MKSNLFLITLIISSIFISCSTSYRSAPSYSYGTSLNHSKTNDLAIVDKDNSHYDSENIKRKILFSAFLSIAVEFPDTANSHIEKIAKKYKGYVNQIGTYKTIIRVKSDNLNDAIDEISELGKIQSKSITGQDVTESYLDYQIRLENAEKSRKRYLELLERAENVEAALKVEKELERLNETIDLLKGKMNRINHLTEYSTITITLKEKKKPGLLGYIGLGIYYSVKWLFVRN